MKKQTKQNEYTTILIKKALNKHIKLFCKENAHSASRLTEKLWANHISSSVPDNISFTSVWHDV